MKGGCSNARSPGFQQCWRPYQWPSCGPARRADDESSCFQSHGAASDAAALPLGPPSACAGGHAPSAHRHLAAQAVPQIRPASSPSGFETACLACLLSTACCSGVQGRVLVRVVAAGLNPIDCKTRSGGAFPFGPLTRLPKIPGGDLAGVVEQAPAGSRFRQARPGSGEGGLPREPEQGGKGEGYPVRRACLLVFWHLSIGPQMLCGGMSTLEPSLPTGRQPARLCAWPAGRPRLCLLGFLLPSRCGRDLRRAGVGCRGPSGPHAGGAEL